MDENPLEQSPWEDVREMGREIRDMEREIAELGRDPTPRNLVRMEVLRDQIDILELTASAWALDRGG